MSQQESSAPVKVYWQPGCSSCLKTKEFLLAHGVAFDSINVLEDAQGFKQLEKLGVRLVPIVARGADWANGAVFKEVARVAGFDYGGHQMLPPEDIVARINTILSGAQRFTRQIPENVLDTMLPNRPRSYRQLSYHIFLIADLFVDLVEKGERLTYEALGSDVPARLKTREDLIDYGAAAQTRVNNWWDASGRQTDFDQPGDVYYGNVTLHEVLERTAWHAAQHTRQLMDVVEKLGITPDRPLCDRDYEDLPMPVNVWDVEQT